jgi:ribose transport system ATP-binding protein
MIFQELMDAPPLTVAENICLGDWPRRRRMVDWPAMYARAEQGLADLGASIDVRRAVGTLSIGERQIVELARAVVGRVRCLVLDEPTAALSASEAERLFGYVRRMRASGVAIVYITHRLDEVQAIADRVQVLRDGSTVLTGAVADVERADMVTAMVGRAVESQRPPARRDAGAVAPALEVVGAASERAFEDVSFTVLPGEVLGLYGKIGSGIGEVAEALFGTRPLSEGTLAVDAQPFAPRGPAQAIKRGIGLLPGDRQREGAFMIRSVAENLAAPSWGALSRHGWITARQEGEVYRRWHERLRIRSRNEPSQPFMTLSGGNQQKVLLARWLQRDVRVLILVEPTRGVDVGARQEIYRAIRSLTEQGVAVLVASSDHDEIYQLADRAAIMVRGRLTSELGHDAITPHALVRAAAGAAGDQDD